MGIDFSHCDAHWSYSGFNRFRGRLAAQLGFDWEKMTGDFLSRTPPDEIENQRFIATKDLIEPLLFHSDCDGELGPDECGQVASRLKELIKDWPDSDYDKRQALELIEGMLAAHAENESLEFR